MILPTLRELSEWPRERIESLMRDLPRDEFAYGSPELAWVEDIAKLLDFMRANSPALAEQARDAEVLQMIERIAPETVKTWRLMAENDAKLRAALSKGSEHDD